MWYYANRRVILDFGLVIECIYKKAFVNRLVTIFTNLLTGIKIYCTYLTFRPMLFTKKGVNVLYTPRFEENI